MRVSYAFKKRRFFFDRRAGQPLIPPAVHKTVFCPRHHRPADPSSSSSSSLNRDTVVDENAPDVINNDEFRVHDVGRGDAVVDTCYETERLFP